jgi:hypothetical protein
MKNLLQPVMVGLYCGSPNPEFELMTYPGRLDTKELLIDLVHDLRQPLGTLEYSVCCLERLCESQAAVRQQLRLIGEQIDLASRLLSEAAARVSRPSLQPVTAEESLDLTKSETAALT